MRKNIKIMVAYMSCIISILFATILYKTTVRADEFLNFGCYEYDFTTKKETFEQILNPELSENEVLPGSMGAIPTTLLDGTESSIAPFSIIGDDGRTKITNTTAIPIRWIGFLRSYWPDGTITRGTAWLYAKQMVMTAGHCIYNPEKQCYATKIVFYPGFNEGTAPYGSFTAVKAKVTRQYKNNADSNYDAGLLKLNSPIGEKIGYFRVQYNNNVSGYLNQRIWITGYPGDKSYSVY